MIFFQKYISKMKLSLKKPTKLCFFRYEKSVFIVELEYRLQPVQTPRRLQSAFITSCQVFETVLCIEIRLKQQKRQTKITPN
jgi:hypothetical protein